MRYGKALDDMPFAVVAAGDGFTNCLSRADAGWTDGTVTVAIDGKGSVSVRSPGKGLSSVTLSWTRQWPCGTQFLASLNKFDASLVVNLAQFNSR